MEREKVEALKRLEAVEADKAAPGSLEWYERAHRLRSEIETRTVMHHLGAGPHDVVLDAGSGVGRVSLALAPGVRKVISVDISPRSVARLLEHAAARGLSNVTAFDSDLNSLEIEPRSVDRAVAVEVVQHIPTHELRVDALERICAALKPGGRFVTVNYRWGGAITGEKEGRHGDGRYRFAFTPADLRGLLSAAGFASIRVRGCANLPYRLEPLGRALPGLAVAAELLWSSLPVSVRTGQFLLASGVRP